MPKTYGFIIGCLVLSPTASHCAESLLWPDAGHFFAYPPESMSKKLQFSASAGLARDSNLFRLAENKDPLTTIGSNDKSDTVRRIGLGFKADLPVSRQHFLLDANIDRYTFDRFGF